MLIVVDRQRWLTSRCHTKDGFSGHHCIEDWALWSLQGISICSGGRFALLTVFCSRSRDPWVIRWVSLTRTLGILFEFSEAGRCDGQLSRMCDEHLSAVMGGCVEGAAQNSPVEELRGHGARWVSNVPLAGLGAGWCPSPPDVTSIEEPLREAPGKTVSLLGL